MKPENKTNEFKRHFRGHAASSTTTKPYKTQTFHQTNCKVAINLLLANYLPEGSMSAAAYSFQSH